MLSSYLFRFPTELDVLEALEDAVRGTGGVRRIAIYGCSANTVVPVAEAGYDLCIGEAYLLACKVLGVTPKIVEDES